MNNGACTVIERIFDEFTDSWHGHSGMHILNYGCISVCACESKAIEQTNATDKQARSAGFDLQSESRSPA